MSEALDLDLGEAAETCEAFRQYQNAFALHAQELSSLLKLLSTLVLGSFANSLISTLEQASIRATSTAKFCGDFASALAKNIAATRATDTDNAQGLQASSGGTGAVSAKSASNEHPAFDPRGLLDDARLNPSFASALRKGLDDATKAGLRPEVREAYRTPERSAVLYRDYVNGTGHKAADAWVSLHNYGLAADIRLRGEDGKLLEGGPALAQASQELRTHLERQGLVWGGTEGDRPHWEYHPAWSDFGGPGKVSPKALRERAIEASKQSGRPWLNHFWEIAGASKAN